MKEISVPVHSRTIKVIIKIKKTISKKTFKKFRVVDVGKHSGTCYTETITIVQCSNYTNFLKNAIKCLPLLVIK